MIGNTIEFYYYDNWCKRDSFKYYELRRDETKAEREARKKTGLVVDAYTKIEGSIRGKSETIFGFGAGETNGETNSTRMYKVEIEDRFSKRKEYVDIEHTEVLSIVSYAPHIKQELNEEKIK